MSQPGTHLDRAGDVTPSSDGCEDCLRIGGQWVHLRMCRSCGHVGCCDSSPHRHTRADFRSHQHPLIQSDEPGEDWCDSSIDDVAFAMDGMPAYSQA
ncbi:MAG: UBP-type zinc finger domain-containing protein [Acidimicrobiia bacterium]